VTFPVYHADARSILTATSGFIAQAGFTHSLSPARNCTFGCTYCYVPTMGIYGGLKPDDWEHWGCFTTFKSNAAELLQKSLRPNQIIYCSPLVDPYQPAEAEACLMPRLIDALIARPPRVFTTNREEVRRLYEPLCPPIAERIAVVRRLREAGIAVYATLAPILPCDPDALVEMAVDATDRDIIADPFHVRAVKSSGATTRDAALRISERRRYHSWHEPAFQAAIIESMRSHALCAGRRLGTGPRAFGWLAETDSCI